MKLTYCTRILIKEATPRTISEASTSLSPRLYKITSSQNPFSKIPIENIRAIITIEQSVKVPGPLLLREPV